MERPVLVTVKGIALEQETRLPILLLRCDDDQRVVPVPIGPSEASSIIIEIEGVTPPRPLAHDLIAELLQRHRLRPRRLEIYGVMQEKHLARFIYGSRLRPRSLEVRPSDGVAIALRTGVPIYLAGSIAETTATALSSNEGPSGAEILYLVSRTGARASGQ